MNEIQIAILVIYAFCAGLVAARVWRRLSRLDFSMKEKVAITAIWSMCCLVSWPFLKVMDEIR